MKKIVIIGNDIHAFVAAYIFRKSGFKVVLLDGSENGNGIVHDFIYIRNTPDTLSLVRDLDVLYSIYPVRGGIMLHEKVYPFPRHLRNLDKDYVKRIRYDYFKKTRKIVIENTTKAMVRPIATKTKTAIRSDLRELCEKLTKSIIIVKRKIHKVAKSFVEFGNNGKISFDKLVVACPLWEFKEVADWHIPSVLAMRSHVACVTQKEDVYTKYDYIYTPYTPANCIHFLWNDGERFYVEMSGAFDRLSLESDLNFLFKRGWYLTKVYKDLAGYILPFETSVTWPKNVSPISPFSMWSDCLSFDDTLFEVKRLAKKWISER